MKSKSGIRLKKWPQSVRKFIRKRKAKLRKELSGEDLERALASLKQQFSHVDKKDD